MKNPELILILPHIKLEDFRILISLLYTDSITVNHQKLEALKAISTLLEFYFVFEQSKAQTSSAADQEPDIFAPSETESVDYNIGDSSEQREYQLTVSLPDITTAEQSNHQQLKHLFQGGLYGISKTTSATEFITNNISTENSDARDENVEQPEIHQTVFSMPSFPANEQSIGTSAEESGTLEENVEQIEIQQKASMPNSAAKQLSHENQNVSVQDKLFDAGILATWSDKPIDNNNESSAEHSEARNKNVSSQSFTVGEQSSGSSTESDSSEESYEPSEVHGIISLPSLVAGEQAEESCTSQSVSSVSNDEQIEVQEQSNHAATLNEDDLRLIQSLEVRQDRVLDDLVVLTPTRDVFEEKTLRSTENKEEFEHSLLQNITSLESESSMLTTSSSHATIEKDKGSMKENKMPKELEISNKLEEESQPKKRRRLDKALQPRILDYNINTRARSAASQNASLNSSSGLNFSDTKEVLQSSSNLPKSLKKTELNNIDPIDLKRSITEVKAYASAHEEYMPDDPNNLKNMLK